MCGVRRRTGGSRTDKNLADGDGNCPTLSGSRMKSFQHLMEPILIFWRE